MIGTCLAEEFGAGGAAHYQPAYYTPGGYQIKQVSLAPLVTHYAPTLSVLNSAVGIDTANPNRETVCKLLVPYTVRLLDRLRSADGGLRAEILFASDADLGQRIGVAPLSTSQGSA